MCVIFSGILFGYCKQREKLNPFKEEATAISLIFSLKMNVIPPGANEFIIERPNGYRAQLEQILNFLNYKENPNLTDFFGTTLLHFAVTDNNDNFEIVEKLIEAGADVNAQNNCKQTPLHLAVLRHNWRMIDILTAHGADVNIKELKGNTALHLALDLLSSKRRQNKQETRSWIVKKLLLCGADPNISNSSGETSLTIAVKYGDLSIVKDLLAFGANVHYRNPYSETFLHLLSRSPEPDITILKELVKHGACVNCCDAIGRTALEVMLEYNKVRNVTQLAESLIKIATLVNWKHGMIFQTIRNREKTRSLEEFMDECHKEVSRMKSYIYSDGSTLCQFAINGRKDAKKDKSQKSVFDEVLDTLTKDDFPIYGDFIEAHFDRAILEEKLFEMNIYTRNRNGKIRLHSYVISDIASYLSGRDLLSLVRAYSKPFFS